MDCEKIMEKTPSIIALKIQNKTEVNGSIADKKSDLGYKLEKLDCQ